MPPHLDNGLVTAIHIVPIQSVQTNLPAVQERNVQRKKIVKGKKKMYVYVLESSHSSACMESAGAT